MIDCLKMNFDCSLADDLPDKYFCSRLLSNFQDFLVFIMLMAALKYKCFSFSTG